jgi:signal peptidase I
MTKDIFTNKWFKFIVVGALYTLWVIWLGNYWWLIGLAVIFDIYVTDKVHWAFWKKKNPPGGKQTKVVEWIDAIIFAVIAASFIRMFFIEAYTIPTSSMEKSLLVGDYLFVSKVAYGPKTPNTPISFPFVHNTMPLSGTKKSYVEWVKRPYKRLEGFGSIKNNDVVVFHFPEGDTVALFMQSQSYYQLVRSYGRQRVWTEPRSFGEIITHPVDKRENYIKRCIGLPGDVIQINRGDVQVNGQPQKKFEGIQYTYLIRTNGTAINPRALDRLNIALDDRNVFSSERYMFPLTSENAEALKGFANVVEVEKLEEDPGEWDPMVFPHNKNYPWNVDNFGPLTVPAKGQTVQLTLETLPLYERIIRVYEGNELDVQNNSIIINGQAADNYTFKMNYFWMMGDNRHNSADSRMWGFVPEDHVVGKASFIWLSINKDRSFPQNVRLRRMFQFIK